MITIGYGCLWPHGHFGRWIADELATRVYALSAGALCVQVTPPTPDMQATQAVLDGTLQMHSSHAIQHFVPELGLSYLPYLYRSDEHFRRVWTLGASPVADALLKRFAARALPVEVLGTTCVGKRDLILHQRGFAGMRDFAGLRIRVDGSATATATFAALHAVPVEVEYHCTLQALLDGKVDAAENSPFNLVAMGWWQACRQVVLTGHLMLMNVEIVNAPFWSRLGSAHRSLLRSEVRRAGDAFARQAQARYGMAVGELARKGLCVNRLPQDELEALRAALQPVREQFVACHGLEREHAYIVRQEAT